MKKRILLLVLAFITLLGFTGCTPKEKVFQKNDFKITLNDSFKEDTYEGTNYYFISDKSALTVLKESFKDLNQINITSESSLDDYADAVLSANNKEIEVIKEKDFYYFVYDSTINNNKYYYLSVIIKGKDSFWLINFFGNYEDKDTLESEFLKYAKTIEV